jgi:hypothetical protein
MSAKAVHRMVEAYLKQGEMMVSIWQDTVRNTEFPVNDRWELFIIAPVSWHKTHTSARSPIDHIIGQRSPHDDYYMSRGQGITAKDIDDRIVGDWIPDDEDDALVDATFVTSEQHEQVREYLMQNLIGIWSWDW